MKVGRLKKLLSKCDDESEIVVSHGGSHELPIVALIGSTDVDENRRHGYGILTGTQDVLTGYISRIDQVIAKDPQNAATWRKRKDFWLDEAKTLEAAEVAVAEPKDEKMVVYEKTVRKRIKLNNRKLKVREDDES